MRPVTKLYEDHGLARIRPGTKGRTSRDGPVPEHPGQPAADDHEASAIRTMVTQNGGTSALILISAWRSCTAP